MSWLIPAAISVAAFIWASWHRWAPRHPMHGYEDVALLVTLIIAAGVSALAWALWGAAQWVF